MKRKCTLFCILVISCIFTVTVFAEEPEIELSKKEKIIVFPFTESQQFGFKIGQAVADTIITRLIEMKRFEVADRVNIEKIMKEQMLGLSGMMDESNAVQVGNLLGAKTSIMGSVTGFSVGKSKKQSFDGSLTIDIKVVDVETTKIEKATTLSVSASVGPSLSVSDNTSKANVRTKLLKKVSDKFFNTMRDYFRLKTYIMTVDGSKVSLRMGRDMGIKKNFRFDAVSRGAEIKDPITGELLEVKKNKIAHIWVTKVDNKISYGRISSKKGVVTPGLQLVEVPTLNIFTSISGGVFPFKQAAISNVSYDDGINSGNINFNFGNMTQAIIVGLESGKQFYRGTASFDVDVLYLNPIIGLKLTAGGMLNVIKLGPFSLGAGAKLGGFGALAALTDTVSGGTIPLNADFTAACLTVGGEISARVGINFSESFAFNVNCGYAHFFDAPWSVRASWGDDESATISKDDMDIKPGPLQLQGIFIRAGLSWSF